jgi:hypothetical protein
MDEQELDALFPYRPFGTKEATKEDARSRRCSTLASALFGKTPEDLRRQLLAPYPKIPAGFSLDDFRDLQKRTRALLAFDPTIRKFAWLREFTASHVISVGTQRYSLWEARHEIVRRAIEYTENQN